jgi:hypothetical protein
MAENLPKYRQNDHGMKHSFIISSNTPVGLIKKYVLVQKRVSLPILFIQRQNAIC